MKNILKEKWVGVSENGRYGLIRVNFGGEINGRDNSYAGRCEQYLCQFENKKRACNRTYRSVAIKALSAVDHCMLFCQFWLLKNGFK